MMMKDDYESNLEFIGPPVGWFGEEWKILSHVSVLNRFINQTHYAEGYVQINGIGKRFESKERSCKSC